MSLNNSELRYAQVGAMWAASLELSLSFCAWVVKVPNWALLFTMGVLNLVILGCLVLMRGYMPGRGEEERLKELVVELGNYLVEANRQYPRDLWLRKGRSIFEHRDSWRPMHKMKVLRLSTPTAPRGHIIVSWPPKEDEAVPHVRKPKRLPRQVKGLGMAVLFLLAAQGWADAVVMPTDRITGFMLGPSLLVQAAGYSFASNGDLTPSAEVIAGGQMGVYLGTYGLSKDDAIQFDPTFYVIPLGLGFGSEYGHTHLVYTCALGYRGFGLTTSWNLGTGEPPLVGVEANITLVDLVQGMDYAFGYDRHFPSGHWSQ